MEPQFNVWFEIDGEVAVSRWRMELLSAIGEHGSITAGAEAIGVPYRVAWQKIREMEERLGEWRRRRPDGRGTPPHRPHAEILRPVGRRHRRDLRGRLRRSGVHLT